MSQWNFWIDRGGTFTDVIGRDPQGGLQAGAPAGPEFDGASGVNTQMTNCRLTDPEILKTRSPVLLEESSIRRGLGGRSVTRLATARDAPSIFSRRWNAQFSAVIARVPPFGLGGGEAAELGRNLVRRADAVTVITPTDGGFGPAVIDGERFQGRVWLRKSRVVRTVDATPNCNLYQ